MGALPYKTNGSLKRREPYRIKQMGVLKGGSPTARNRKTAVLLATQLFYLRFENMVKLNLYYIDMKYVRNLSHVDEHVMSVSPQRQKQSRPFVGIVIMLNGRIYCFVIISQASPVSNLSCKLYYILSVKCRITEFNLTVSVNISGKHSVLTIDALSSVRLPGRTKQNR
ncbi:MAG: type III toxin-antitoxin system ToxN/AbiQ family toxin [Oscillospiraceae bacterium]